MKQSGQEELLRAVMAEVTEKITVNLRDTLAKTLEEQLSEALTQSLLESEFYRKMSKDMRSGLKKIYKKIDSAANTTSAVEQGLSKTKSDQLFHEASAQLNAVLEQTEEATDGIMSVVERNLDDQAKVLDVFANIKNQSATAEEYAWFENYLESLDHDWNTILTTLSFQDLTGQRIKKAVAALQEIETTVVELFLSSGLLIQAYESEPGKNLDQIEEETQKTLSSMLDTELVGTQLKGPSKDGVSQQNIDDLLAQLGMD